MFTLRQVVVEVQAVHVNDIDREFVQNSIDVLLENSSRLVFRIVIQNASWNLRGDEKPIASRTSRSKNQGPVTCSHQSFVKRCKHLFGAAGSFSRYMGQRVTHAEHSQRHECSCRPASAEVASSRQRAAVMGQPMHSYQ